MEIIPAIDIIDGKCVRLSQGNYDRKKVYYEDPLDVARMFEDWGLSRLHLVDLDGAKARHIVNHGILQRIADKTKLVIDFGGGIKSDRDVDIAFKSGARMLTIGSVAVKDPEIFLDWLEKYGSENIILGADHIAGEIAISGWTETSGRKLIDFINDYIEKGVKKVLCTDISVDGMLTGPSIEVYKKLLDKFEDIHLIASGGVSKTKDLTDLKNIGIQSVVVGKAIYEGRISKEEIQTFLG